MGQSGETALGTACKQPRDLPGTDWGEPREDPEAIRGFPVRAREWGHLPHSSEAMPQSKGEAQGTCHPTAAPDNFSLRTLMFCRNFFFLPLNTIPSENVVYLLGGGNKKSYCF